MLSFTDPVDIIVTVIAFIVIFSVVVISHEFGHFIIARANGIRVVEFTVGMGPKLISREIRGTIFSIRLLPIGGACMFEDEDALLDESEDKKREEQENPLEEVRPGEKGSFRNANVWSRIATVVAGPVFNVILAFLLGLILVAFCGENTTVLGEVTDGSPAKEAGLLAGDEITKINGQRVYLFSEIILENFVNGKNTWEVEYLRDGKKYETTLTPVLNPDTGSYQIGIVSDEKIDCANLKMFEYSWYEVRYWLKATFKSLKMLITGRLQKDDISGPVGMAQVIGTTVSETKQYGPLTVLMNLINIAILLSVNLGVMNLLPFPALDGGRLLILFVEAIVRKKIPATAEAIINMVGFVLLMILMVFVLVNDISKFFR